MKILITGARGQLGYKLKDILKNHELILTNSRSMNITDKNAVSDKINEKKPDIVFHAAAYTKVDDAESNQELCHKVNAEGTKNIIEACNQNNVLLIFISTDYVFDGKKNKPYREIDETGEPLSIYGKSKKEAENEIEKNSKKYYILRTSWLYGELPPNHPGSNFVETMLKLSKTRNKLSVVSDQIGSPTYTGDLTNGALNIIERYKTDEKLPFGIYHLSGKGEASWYDFAVEIFKLSKTNIKVNPISTEAYPLPAKRPKYSYLSKEKIESFGIKVRPWQQGLKEYLEKRQI